MNRIIVEKQIKQIIKKHYGLHLWSYKPDLEYNDAIAPFVTSLIEIINPTIIESER